MPNPAPGAGGPQSNGPVMAEWTRGTSAVQSGVSIGFVADAEAEDRGMVLVDGAAQPQAAQGNPVKGGVRTSDANEGPHEREERGGHAERDAKVVNGAPPAERRVQRPPSLDPPEGERPREDGPASQYATLMNGGDQNEENKDEEGTVVARKAMSSANGPDSMSAISKAGRDSQQEVAAGHNSKLHDAQRRDSMNQVKPTESLSSAAAGVFPGSYAAAIATAASLVSQNTGRAAMMNKSLSSELPIDTNEALNALTHIPSPVNNPLPGTASHNQAHAKSPRFADWPGAAAVSHGTRPSRIGQTHQVQLQNQMQNSSNSGNHQQKISPAQIPPKNRSLSSASKKHPMRPPPTAAAAAIARMNVALPTGSSSRPGGMGLQIQLDQLAHTAEDAVSTMQPEAGDFVDMCDAVSMASGEAHSGGDKEDTGYTESRVVQHASEDMRERAPAEQSPAPPTTGNRRVTRSMAKSNKRLKKKSSSG